MQDPIGKYNTVLGTCLILNSWYTQTGPNLKGRVSLITDYTDCTVQYHTLGLKSMTL